MKSMITRCARICAFAIVLLSTVSGGYSAALSEQVPFKGHAAGTIVSIVPTPGGAVFTIHASGNATQLGQYTRVETLLLNPFTGAFTGTIDFTAANGDVLSVAVAGQFTTGTTAVGTYTMTGGTGRFVGATGNATFSASTDFVNVRVDFNGTISTVGG